MDLDAFAHDPAVEESLRSTASTELGTESDDSSLSVPDLASTTSSNSSTSSLDMDKPSISLCPAKVPAFIEIAPEVPAPPAVLNALHRFKADVLELGISAIDFYQDLRVSSIHLSDSVPPKGHVDGGALATTTDRLEYIWSYREYQSDELPQVTRLRVADDTIHVPRGAGYLKVPCTTNPGFMFVRCFYTPQIPATILSPNAITRLYGCKGYSTYSDLIDNSASMQLVDCSECETTVNFDLQLIRGLLYTDSLIAPTATERSSSTIPSTVPVDVTDPSSSNFVDDIRVLSRDQQRALWHMRLGHTHERLISDLHKYVDGIPALPRSDVLHSCPMCMRAKLHKANRGPSEERPAEACWQHIQVDFGFMVQRSQARKVKTSSPKKTSRKRQRPQQLVKDLRSLIHVRALRRSRRSTKFSGSFSGDNPRESASPRATVTSPSPPDGTSPSESDSVGSDATPIASGASPPPVADSQTYMFEKIEAHQGPLDKSHKRYLGCPFNLKIRWSTGETTWEPLQNIFEDSPDDVVEYARHHNLLNNPDWSAVRDLALDPAYQAQAAADHEDEFETLAFDPVTPAAHAEEGISERFKRLRGINGETCYVLITDRKGGAIKVAVRRDKSPPIDYFKSFLAHHAPPVSNRTVRFDGGGELGGNTNVHKLFEQAGYEVEVTAPDSSSEIGHAERPHRTIADAVRTMLFAAGLDLKYWPYALLYHVLIHNCLPHGDRLESAITICTGKRVNISLLRIFGCRIYALPSSKRDAKLDIHARSGIFLGYKKSMRHAYYIDSSTGTIKTARHIAFDEGMSDSPHPPPYVKFLKANPNDIDHQEFDLDHNSDDVRVSLSPFNQVEEFACTFRPRDVHPLGFQIGHCPRFLRAFATAFNRPLDTFTVEAANRRFLGGYILKVGDYPVYSTDDIAAVVDKYRKLDVPPKSLVIRIARDQKAKLSDSRPPSLHLRPVDIRRVAAMNLVAGEGHFSQQRSALRELAATSFPSATPADPPDLVWHTAAEMLEMRKLTNDHMTPEERALPSFTRKNLMKLPNWDQWQAADDLQLDTHYKSGTIGQAVPRPDTKDPDKPSQVFRLHWARLVKASGVRKSRACLDGSKRAAPWLRSLVQTYSSCVELPCLRAFIAICVNRGYYICFGDVENAYQQSPPPSIDCFLDIDDTVYDWYLRKFNVKLDRLKDVIPLYRALQGHPEAGVLWERMINDILINKMGFKNTAHEKNLYTGTIDGHEILVCRQVDDFASGATTKEAAESFITAIRKYVEAEYAAMGIETDGGMFQRYNGIDVFQTRDYVKVSCESYIDRMLQTHGWDAPVSKEPSKAIPLNPAAASKLMTLEGPPEKTEESRAIAKKFGFSYRNLLGELIYAYVICRLDIGYAVCCLARFSDKPHEQHFVALKGICKYLRATKAWGIMYQRPSPFLDLPHVPFDFLEEDPNLPPFPVLARDELAGCLDAAHATELKSRRSVTGLIMFFCCAAIAWKSRVQPIVATSSTEAEFYAAVTCAKIAKYLRYVLTELNAIAPGPTKLFIDNMAALMMINESRPTPRARHIEIQHFAIQEWRERGDILMQHLAGIINAGDGLTKPLGWVLHARHARRGMGHYKIGSP